MESNCEKYSVIDNLRVISCIGIIMMHISSNSNFAIQGFMYDTVIPSFTNFVFLFMSISAFGMCCGYYDKVINNTLNIENFYKKRIKKILPFFAVLVFIDLFLFPSVSSLKEGFANLTLLFGYLPNAGNISVIGVGWFLGLIFVFYIFFPYFCFLLKSKKRAWLSMGMALVYTLVCSKYFEIERTNFLYCLSFFMIGGILFLYRNEIKKINKTESCVVLLLCVCLYYVFSGNVFMCLVLTCALLMNAIVFSSGGGQRKIIV